MVPSRKERGRAHPTRQRAGGRPADHAAPAVRVTGSGARTQARDPDRRLASDRPLRTFAAAASGRPRKVHMRKLIVALAVEFTVSGCALLRPVDSDADYIEVFEYGVPASPFTKVADLAFWVPKSGMGEPTIDDILPELRDRAKHAGADAVVDVHW